jgi:integrase
MRFPKPFFRASKQAWYLQLGKRQVSLGKDRDEAFARYRQYLLHEEGKSLATDQELTVAEICDLFLEHSEHNHAVETYRWYLHFLSDFCGYVKKLKVVDLKPFNVTKWMQTKSWGPTSQNRVIGGIKRVLNWALGEGLVGDNPLKLMKKPTSKRRERYLTAAERRQILAAAKGQDFRMFLFAMSQSGARPGEIRLVTANDLNFEQGAWILEKHKTAKKTGKPRIIYMTPPLRRLCERLVAKSPTGPIFRNSRNQPWTKNAIQLRFRQLRKKLGLDPGVVAYCYRHAYITDALERGVSDATVAALVGHESTDMIHRHYSHLSEKRSFLSNAATQIMKPLPKERP